jgi:hypothetical protein
MAVVALANHSPPYLEKESAYVSATSISRELDDSYLIVSPYTEDDHLLQLDSVEPQCQFIARALTVMQVLRPDYATSPYSETFNWPEVIAQLRQILTSNGHKWQEQKFFVVVFKSQIPPTTVYSDLGKLDKAAHAEATQSGGFLKYVWMSSQAYIPADKTRYWFGSPDRMGRNLATCIWRSQDDARRGGTGPAHREAAGSARHLYTDWNIERHALVIRDNAEEWEITPWSG